MRRVLEIFGGLLFLGVLLIFFAVVAIDPEKRTLAQRLAVVSTCADAVETLTGEKAEVRHEQALMTASPPRGLAKSYRVGLDAQSYCEVEAKETTARIRLLVLAGQDRTEELRLKEQD